MIGKIKRKMWSQLETHMIVNCVRKSMLKETCGRKEKWQQVNVLQNIKQVSLPSNSRKFYLYEVLLPFNNEGENFTCTNHSRTNRK